MTRSKAKQLVQLQNLQREQQTCPQDEALSTPTDM